MKEIKRSEWYYYWEEKILNAEESDKLEILLDNVEGDCEAGNITEEEKEILICKISDQEGKILLDGGY